MKIKKLTQEQEELIPHIRQKFLDYFFSCKNSINKEAVKTGIDWLYNFCGLKSPTIIHVSSPMGCQYAAHYLKVYKKIITQDWSQTQSQIENQVCDQISGTIYSIVKNQIRSNINDQIRNKIRDQVNIHIQDRVWTQINSQTRNQILNQVNDQIRIQINDQIRNKIFDQVSDQINDQISNPVRSQVNYHILTQLNDQIRSHIRSQVNDQIVSQVSDQITDQISSPVRSQMNYLVKDQILNQVNDQIRINICDQVNNQIYKEKYSLESFSIYGNVWDYGWISFYEFFKTIGVKIESPSYEKFKSLIFSGVYDMIQLNGFCIVSDLPDKILRNSRNRLHAEDQSAIHFRDGYELYFWNGVCVPSKWILNKENISKEDIVKESNAEKRRCLREILGAKRYYDLISDGNGLSLLDEDIDEQGFPMKLYETNMKDDLINKKVQFIEVVCPSTKRVYNIYPPSQNSKNVWEAKADTFRKEKIQYRHGDVGLLNINKNYKKPLVET